MRFLLSALKILTVGLVAASVAVTAVAALTVWSFSGEDDPYAAMARIECIESPVDVCLPPAGPPQRLP